MRAVVDLLQRLAGIGAAEQRGVLRIHDVRVPVIGEDVRVVERALTNAARIVHRCPRRAGIVTPEQATAVVLHQRVHALGIRGRRRDTDASDEPRRQARVARDLRPGLATVGALEQATARTAARHLVFLAIRLPQRGIHHVRVGAIERDVDGAGLFVAEQHFLPRGAAVRALEHTAFRTRHAVLAERRDEDDVGIGRMDADLRDAMRFAEADVRPRLARIAAAVDAIARHDVAANRGLAHADEHEVRLRLTHRDGAHRCAPDLPIRHGLPGFSAVDRLPEPAAGRPEIRLVGATLHAAGRDGTTAAIGADVAPPIAGHQRRVGGNRRRRNRIADPGTRKTRRDGGEDRECGEEQRARREHARAR